MQTLPSLLQRLDDLEAAQRRLAHDHLLLANATSQLAPDRTQFFADLLLPLPEEEPIPKSTLNLSPIRSSATPESAPLVQRVSATLAALVNAEAGDSWDTEARAVIREIATWLRDQAGGTRAAWMLEQAAKRSTPRTPK